jgi:hypothetical protein
MTTSFLTKSHKYLDASSGRPRAHLQCPFLEDARFSSSRVVRPLGTSVWNAPARKNSGKYLVSPSSPIKHLLDHYLQI